MIWVSVRHAPENAQSDQVKNYQIPAEKQE